MENTPAPLDTPSRLFDTDEQTTLRLAIEGEYRLHRNTLLLQAFSLGVALFTYPFLPPADAIDSDVYEFLFRISVVLLLVSQIISSIYQIFSGLFYLHRFPSPYGYLQTVLAVLVFVLLFLLAYCAIIGVEWGGLDSHTVTLALLVATPVLAHIGTWVTVFRLRQEIHYWKNIDKRQEIEEFF